MYIDQSLEDTPHRAIGEKNYMEEVNVVWGYKQNFDIYGNAIPLIALFAFLVYFIFRGRMKRFEATIVLVMSLKYAIGMTLAIL